MKPTDRKKLTLARETLKTLTRQQLRGAAGASPGQCDPNHSPSGCFTDSDQSRCCAIGKVLLE
jgi:hypothetical protein